tara:strand:- start:254 stop:931 length:678 start_codon:yes stop_codon:yes gene_type:complete
MERLVLVLIASVLVPINAERRDESQVLGAHLDLKRGKMCPIKRRQRMPCLGSHCFEELLLGLGIATSRNMFELLLQGEKFTHHHEVCGEEHAKLQACVWRLASVDVDVYREWEALQLGLLVDGSAHVGQRTRLGENQDVDGSAREKREQSRATHVMHFVGSAEHALEKLDRAKHSAVDIELQLSNGAKNWVWSPHRRYFALAVEPEVFRGALQYSQEMLSSAKTT